MLLSQALRDKVVQNLLEEENNMVEIEAVTEAHKSDQE